MTKEAQRQQNVRKAVVVRASPLEVELLHAQRRLDEEDFHLSQWVKYYDDMWGIAVKDIVVMVLSHGEWTITDVVSDTVLS